MPSKRVPKYRLHRATGRAVVTLPSPARGHRGRDVFLGRYGSQESREQYARVLAEWNIAGTQLSRAGDSLTIVELCVAYVEYATTYYRKDGESTTEVAAITAALNVVQQIYGHTPAVEFGPLKLKTVRQAMIARGLVRSTINAHCSRIKRCFAWGVENEIGGTSGSPPIPLLTGVHHALSAVKGLRMGRCEANESVPVKPVSEADIRAIESHVSSTIWAMVQIQLLTGMRPGEIILMRPIDVDTSGAVWMYRPATHKTAHHGKDRVVAIGPRAISILRPLLPRDLHAHVFSPRADAEAVLVNGTSSRRGLTIESRSRPPGDHYTTQSYGKAIARGCALAGIPPWGPNRLRHSAATLIRKEFGVEAARIALGHSKIATTEIYAERDTRHAMEIATAVG